MTPFEEHLRSIDNLISVKDEDRQPYTQMFDDVRTWLLREMRQVSPVFDKLFAGTCLFGSYSNGVRLVLPKEFDILFILEFPFQIQLNRDNNRSGFVQLKGAFKKLSKNPNGKDVLTDLNHLFDGKCGLLRRDKFQMWIHDIIEKVIENQPETNYEVSFEKHAVAQNIYVRDKSNPLRKISIDVVPAISINGTNLIRKRKLSTTHYENICAVPKAGDKIPETTYYYTFTIVNVVSERELLWNKQNLKITYRLLKSMRDRYDMHRLKSAFFTHLFLWAVDERLDDFWNKPVGIIFLSMLKKLLGCFKCGSIPYYWVRRTNLMDILKPDEIKSFYAILNKVYMTLMSIKEEKRLTFEDVAKHFNIPDGSRKSK